MQERRPPQPGIRQAATAGIAPVGPSKTSLLLLDGNGLDGLVESALVPGSLVLVGEALVHHARHFGGAGLEGRGSEGGVTRLDGLDDLLDGSAHARAQGNVMLTTTFALLGALGCRLGISHGYFQTVLAEGRLDGVRAADPRDGRVFFGFPRWKSISGNWPGGRASWVDLGRR